MTPHERSSSRGWARKAGVAVVAMLLLALAGEILLRVYYDPNRIMKQIGAQLSASPMVYVPDPDLGALVAPSHRHTVTTPDFTYTLETDHAGFANPEPWPERVDIAVLGDSLLTGSGVGLEGQFTSLLGGRLNGRTVLNLGIPGGGTEHQYRAYRKYAAPLEPKLVIAVLWLTWDIDNSLQFRDWLLEQPDQDYTEYRYGYGARLEDAAQPERGLDRIWYLAKSQLVRSHLVRAAYQSVKSLFVPDRTVEEVSLPNGDTLLLSAREELRLARGANRPGADDLEDLFFGPLERLWAEVEADGGRFVIVLVPSKEELYAAETFPEVLRTVQEVTSELQSRQLPVLNLHPAFRDRDLAEPAFYPVDMHLNERGNQIVADAIATWVVDEEVLSPSAPAASVATVPAK